MNYDNEVKTFDDVCVVGSLDEPEKGGLDLIEQERSLARASRPELDPLFIGIPEKSDRESLAEIRKDRKQRQLSMTTEDFQKLREELDSQNK